MRQFSLRLTLVAGVAALALPVAAQEPPTPGVPQPAEAIAPMELLPPLIAPVEDGEEARAATGEAAPTAPPIPEIWSPVPFDASGQSAYGLYLSGRLAGMRGDRALGADLLTQTHGLTPEQPVVADEAFRAALFSGDLDSVVRLGPMVQDTPLLADAARLFGVVQSLKQDDARIGLANLRGQPLGDPYGPVGRYLLPAVAAAAGDWDAALAPVETAAGDPAGLVLRDQRAQLLEARRRHEEAEVEYKALMTLPDGARLFRVHYGAFLERRGRKDEALAVYAAALGGSQPDPRAQAAGLRMQAGGRAPALPTINQIAADALTFAALETSQVDIHELSAIYLHLARALHPSDAVTLRLGQSLAAATQEASAREMFAQVTPADPIQYASAQVGLGYSLQRDDRRDEALEAFRRADRAAPNEPVVAYLLAAQLFDLERYEETLQVLGRPEVNTSGQPTEYRFLRGAALEQVGRVDEAEAELWTALQAKPEDPTLLNHLGYLWVDSGRRVEQGAEMIARAYAADPRNGNIQDSLGWSQYRRGLYADAVQTLEEAVAKEPANAEINDHLGDAYWQVGRTREAGWQWSRVLTLDPDPERRAEAEQKLVRGLSPVAPVTGSQP